MKVFFQSSTVTAARRPIRVAASLLAALSSAILHAEDSRVSKTSWETQFSSSVTGGSKFRGAESSGNIGLWNIGGSAVASVQVKDGALIRLGASYQRFNFQSAGTAAIPGKLQSFNLVVGADFQLGDAWLARLEIQPGFYSGSGALRERDLNVPLTFGASYFVNADLQLVAGLRMDLQWRYPVFPGIGVRWKMAENWVLNGILPAPRIEYTFNKSLTVYAGADFNGGSYRMDGNFGSSRGNPKLDNAVVSHTQIRVGGGASWRIGPTVTLDFEGGFVPINQIEYPRADVEFRSSGTPAYGGISLKATY